jgi:Porin PorA
MKGIASKLLIALGIILILAAILWWAIAVNALIRLPDNVDVTNEYEGTMTFYINPLTQEPLPEGSEMKGALTAEQIVKSDKALYDSSTGIVDEEMSIKIEGIPFPMVSKFAYALNRDNNENVKDDRAYSWDPENVVDRAGTYYPLFPFDTSKDETYLFWRNEVDEGITAEFIEEADLSGVTVYNYRTVFENKELAPAYLEYSSLGFPTEITFEDLKPTLTAMGVNVDDFIAKASQAMSPEDLQTLNQALQAPITLQYFWSSDMEFSIEPKTGAPMDISKDLETLSMQPDLTAGMAGLGSLLQDYAADPVLGPYVAQFGQLATQLGQAEPQKVFEYSIASTDATVETAVEDAKTNASNINMVKVYIPWALLIIGALVLIIGLLIGGEGAPAGEAAVESEEKEE